jgi:hypothetical protein
MSRIRLTNRRRLADDVGTDDESQDHETGFGIPESSTPTVASIRAAASKAVKLAVLLLGDKVSEDVIEEQARDFMNLGPEVLEGSLKRFSETEEMYATEDKKDKKEEKDADEDEDADETAKKSSVSEETEVTEAIEEVEEAVVAETTEIEASEETEVAEVTEAAEEVETTEVTEVTKKSSAAELDIELGTTATDEVDNDLDTQALLAQLYGESDEVEASVEQTKEASSKKEGVKSLGGQPTKVASSDGQNEIANLWADAPDVSDVFN